MFSPSNLVKMALSSCSWIFIGLEAMRERHIADVLNHYKRYNDSYSNEIYQTIVDLIMQVFMIQPSFCYF